MENESIKTLLTRRSVRKFKPDHISEEEMEIILEAGKFAPTGRGTQGTKFVVVRNQAVRDKLSAMNAEILADLLEMEGMTSEWAENGQRAVELFEQREQGHFDAILMDMRMPVMDGLAATRAIRSLPRPDAAAIPIIALTANAFEEDVKQCLQAGMDAHLSKPVDITLLKTTLSRLLASKISG